MLNSSIYHVAQPAKQTMCINEPLMLEMTMLACMVTKYHHLTKKYREQVCNVISKKRYFLFNTHNTAANFVFNVAESDNYPKIICVVTYT